MNTELIEEQQLNAENEWFEFMLSDFEKERILYPDLHEWESEPINGISTIDGIKVEIVFTIHYCNVSFPMLFVKIYHNDITLYGGTKYKLYQRFLDIGRNEPVTTKLTAVHIGKAFEKIIEHFKDIYYNKKLGRFVNEIDRVFDTSVACKRLIDCNPKIKSNIKICCVCYENTPILTTCNHSLCLHCWEQIKLSEDDEGLTITACPLCREDLYLHESLDFN